jgi:hypothetical protein
MKTYIFDEDNGSDKRNWEAIVSMPIVRIRHDDTGFNSNQKDVVWEDGIILIHQANEAQLEAVQKVILLRDNLFAIVISGTAQERKSDADRMYFRKTAVNKPEDALFAAHFRQFWDDLQKSGGQQYNFSLLEPTAVPEPLLAYVLAMQYQLKIGNIHELCAAADACYAKLQPYAKSLFDKNRAVSFPEANVPGIEEIQKSESNPGGAMGLRFKAMRNAIDLLREDL